MALDERKIRLAKLEKIREQGLDPYPSRFDKKNTLQQAYEAKMGAKVKTAGRLMTIRDMGKLCFCHLMDETRKMQIALKEDEIGKDEYKWFVKNLDIGDFISVEGEVFKTHKGEISILVTKYTLLAKAIRPLPEKWHGLVDEELRLRKRYLDFITHPELKELFYRKTKFWQTTREFLQKEGFLEVETPVLETMPGGADAEPFITHHNALDLDVYLRISTGELWQKRLMVAGFEKTFEIGRQFRNEGMSKEHLQDYTQMECYWAFADYNEMMTLVEKMYKKIIKEIYGKLIFEIAGFTVDFDKEWKKIDYVETIKKDFDLDVTKATKEALVKKLKE
ncbi:MAG: OB-fold nucleic acid binding domain-containing protein, partial [Candidatus Parcubacteria bacterium]|nr:OB-fold nucleic acid binding domain-containing protein [Candidatus Parcubacteria bacterium]